MKPLFTIHAGEFLVGEFIQQNFSRTSLWIPAEDSGVDLLVSDLKPPENGFASSEVLTRLPRHAYASFSKASSCLRLVVSGSSKISASPADYLCPSGFPEPQHGFCHYQTNRAAEAPQRHSRT